MKPNTKVQTAGVSIAGRLVEDPELRRRAEAAHPAFFEAGQPDYAEASTGRLTRPTFTSPVQNGCIKPFLGQIEFVRISLSGDQPEA